MTWPYAAEFTLVNIDCVQLADGADGPAGVYAQLIINPADAADTTIMFYTDNTCKTAASPASLTGVTWVASSATAKCKDVAFTVTGGTDIASVSVTQDATDTTVFLIESYADALTSTDTCTGTAYAASGTTANACQQISAEDADTDVWAYIGGAVSTALSLATFSDNACTTAYQTAVGVDLTSTSCQTIFGTAKGTIVPTDTGYAMTQFNDVTCTEYEPDSFVTNACFTVAYADSEYDTPTSYQIIQDFNSGDWYSQAFTTSTDCGASEENADYEVFPVDFSIETCQQIAASVWAEVSVPTARRLLTADPSTYTFTTFFDSACSADKATDPVSFDFDVPDCIQTSIDGDAAVYAKVVFGEYYSQSGSSVLSVGLFALVAAVLALLF